MAELLTMQDLANGHLDVKALGEAANGDENTIVTTRTGNTYPSAERAINIMFQNGGLPAVPFATKALMTASALVDGKFAQVTDDTVNNGLYVKKAGAWVKSAYDPTALANTYTDNKVKGVTNNFKTKALMTASTLPNDSYAMVTEDTEANNGRYSKVAGAWVKSGYDPLALAKADATTKADAAKSSAVLEANNYTSVATEGIERTINGVNAVEYIPNYTLQTGFIRQDGTIYTISQAAQYSSLFVVPAGMTLTLTYYGVGLAALAKSVGAGLPMEVIKYSEGTLPNDKKVYQYTPDKDTLVAFSSKTDISPATAVITRAASKGLFDDVGAIKTSLSSLAKTQVLDIPIKVGGYQFKSLTDVSGRTKYAREVTLKSGDILTFDYTPFDGVTLWDWRDAESPNMAWALLSHVENSVTIKSHKFIAYGNMIVRLVGVENNTIRVNGKLSNSVVDLGLWIKEQIPVFNSLGAFARLKTTDFFNVSKGDKIVITKAAKSSVSLTTKDNLGTIKTLLARPQQEGDIRLEWTADVDTKISMSGYTDSEFLIKKANATLEDGLFGLVTEVLGRKELPASMVLPERETVFATAMNYILKTELIDGVDYIKISQDLGKTWTQMPNILGDIVSYHFFSDGTIMLCSPTKVYWTDDYLTLNESNVYDHNGSVFVPTTRHFFMMQTGDSIMYVGDQEIFVWGDYTVSGRTRIWYSLDRGRTIKCAALFGTTVMDGAVRGVRHVHRVYFRKKDETFYIATGDLGAECMIIKAKYNVSADTWAWNVLARGIEYKFGNIIMDDYFAYMVTDYTDPSLADKKGIYRVPIADIGDITKYRMIYNAKASEWGSISLVSLLMDKNGNKVILPDYLGAGFVWVAREGLDFKKISISPSVLLAYTIGENYNGDIYCVAYNNSGELGKPDSLKLNRGTYNLTKTLRRNGVPNFMSNTQLIDGLSTVVS